jgi:hypothetical protein
MITYSRPSTASPKVGRTVLGVRKNNGTQTMDSFSTLTGIGWGQVFMSIDRLSRKGKVSLAPVRPCEYSISIGGLLRR